jgi:hypothetical protein
MSLSVVAVLTPWAVRNALEMDSPIVLAANFGYNLRIGHAPYATGRYLVPQDLWDAQPGLTFQEREILFNDLGFQRAVEYAAEHPREETALSGRKIAALWRPDSDALKWVTSFGRNPLREGYWEPLRILLDVTYLTVVSLSLVGAFLLPSRRGVAFVVVLLFLWTTIHIAFFGEPRYHLPLLAVLAPMAGGSVISIASRTQAWYSAHCGLHRRVEWHGHAEDLP